MLIPNDSVHGCIVVITFPADSYRTWALSVCITRRVIFVCWEATTTSLDEWEAKLLKLRSDEEFCLNCVANGAFQFLFAQETLKGANDSVKTTKTTLWKNKTIGAINYYILTSKSVHLNTNSGVGTSIKI